MDLTKHIEKSKKLDLCSYPHKEIRSLLNEAFAEIGMMIHTLHKTYRMARVRRSIKGRRFTKVSELSYKPKAISNSYLRASIPGNSLFYASSCERRNVHRGAFTDDEFGIKVAIFETLPELRENCLHGRARFIPEEEGKPFKINSNHNIDDIEMTYSIWEVETDINLAKVCYNKMYDNDFVHYNLQQHIYGKYIMDDPQKRINHDVFLNFLSHEFSKLGERYREEYDYMISAIASELLCEQGFEGVSYPSSRSDGFGIDFAIDSSTVDKSLRCDEVGIVTLQNNKGFLELTYLNKKHLRNGEKRFDL
jgi:hypothetical protein